MPEQNQRACCGPCTGKRVFAYGRKILQHTHKPENPAVDLRDPERLFNEALLYIKRREPNMAAHVLRRALELKPREARFLSCLGLCIAMANRRSREAVSLCEEALDAGCFDALLYLNLGKVYLLQGSRRKAYRAFKWGLQVEPRNIDILKQLRAMGVRQRRVFRFLPRGHVVNRMVGRLRYFLRRPIA